MTETNDGISVQPLALIRNNELVYIEEGNEKGGDERKFSCFKIFKLKGPIDVNYLIDTIFPPPEKNHYNLEVCEYSGQSAKIKFRYSDKTHTDLIDHLTNAATKFYEISENGLADWVASDTVTFKTIYQNLDETATLQHRFGNTDVSSDNDSDTDSDYVFIPSSSSSSTSPNVDEEAVEQELKELSENVSSQLYPIVDEGAFERELEELSEKISSKTNLTNYDLERVFHNTFRRRDMSVTVTDIASEFFGQIQNVLCLIPSKRDIEGDLPLNPETIIKNLTRYLFAHAESLINKGTLGLFVKNFKVGIVITLWNLINAINSTRISYELLLEADVKFKQVFQAQKSHFMYCLSNMDQTLMDLLILLHEDLDLEKYERLQRRLDNFITATEDLMKLVMIINKQCNENLEKLENQEKTLSTKLYVAAITIGFAAIFIGGLLYNKKLFSKIEKYLGGALTSATGVAMITGYVAKNDLQNSMKQHTNILDQLKSAHAKLKEWTNLGSRYIEWDVGDMNRSRTFLIENFVKIRSQCSELEKLFD